MRAHTLLALAATAYLFEPDGIAVYPAAHVGTRVSSPS